MSAASSTITDVYEQRTLAFMDILGFSELIETSKTDPSVATRILNLFNTINAAFDGKRSEHFSATIFSDTQCLSAKAGGSFLTFCAGLGAIVTALLSMGHPVRGAITQGKLYHKDSIIFGPSLIRAYDLERKLAFFPRIIIDPTLDQTLLADPDPLATKLQLVYTDADGLTCVNFLCPPLLHAIFILVGLDPHKALADLQVGLLRMTSKASSESAQQKLKWLVTYTTKTIDDTPVPTKLIDEILSHVHDQAAQ